jgi:hypothetical protein
VVLRLGDRLAGLVPAGQGRGRRHGLRAPGLAGPCDDEPLDAALLSEGGPEAKAAAWSSRYFLRRTAWHVLDHAWELQDKTDT